MDSVSTPSGPIRNIGAWTFEQLQAWADRPDHHGQELERIREVTVRHAQDDHLDPADRKRWAKLSLQVNARMHGDSPWQQARMAANNFRLRILIIDRLGPDIQDSDWNPDLVAADILAALILTPTQARELSDHWQALPVERIGELRDVKSTTAPLQRLPPPPAWSNPRPGPRMARHPRTPALSNEQGRPRHAGGHRSELSPQDPSTRSEASVLDTVHNENTQVTELSILKAQDNARKRHIATDTLGLLLAVVVTAASV